MLGSTSEHHLLEFPCSYNKCFAERDDYVITSNGIFGVIDETQNQGTFFYYQELFSDGTSFENDLGAGNSYTSKRFAPLGVYRESSVLLPSSTSTQVFASFHGSDYPGPEYYSVALHAFLVSPGYTGAPPDGRAVAWSYVGGTSPFGFGSFRHMLAVELASDFALYGLMRWVDPATAGFMRISFNLDWNGTPQSV